MRRTITPWSLLVALAAPAVSHAQTAQPLPPAQTVPSENDQLARERFLAGRDAFSSGDFATAAREFERAYALSRRTQLLYNIGTAYERLHRWEEARSAFQRYLDAHPEAPDRAEVEGRLRVIEVEIQHQQSRGSGGTPQVVVVERPVTYVEPSRPWRVVFWVTAGVGLLTGVGTLAVGLLADRRYNELATSCAPNCRSDDVSDMELRAGIVNAGFVLTGALVATAVVSLVLDSTRSRVRREAPGTPQPTVSLLPGGAVLGLGGTL